MENLIDLQDYKARRLALLVAKFDEFMARAETFDVKGMQEMRKRMLVEAAKLRPQIDALRTPPPKPEPFLKQASTYDYTFTYNANMGWPKPER